MKKLLFIAVAALFLFSCKKENQKRCWDCQIRYYAGTEPTQQTICDKSREEIDVMIRGRMQVNGNDTNKFSMKCQ